ncbi:unnamed protein product [Nezara viridula]|uniref:Uncharacterized protein n=1 Tax=Nezara viridula TaxID=85310 RepID=A0A9P0HTP9_NEZVI|nr:unnamed protein product [Nezara viridula]
MVHLVKLRCAQCTYAYSNLPEPSGFGLPRFHPHLSSRCLPNQTAFAFGKRNLGLSDGQISWHQRSLPFLGTDPQQVRGFVSHLRWISCRRRGGLMRPLSMRVSFLPIVSLLALHFITPIVGK